MFLIVKAIHAIHTIGYKNGNKELKPLMQQTKPKIVFMIFAVYCNPTITNVCIKQQASISRRTAMEVFKRPLFTRHRIFIEKKIGSRNTILNKLIHRKWIYSRKS